MSGGSYDYAYRHLDQFADDLTNEHSETHVRELAEYLRTVATLMRDIEWADSGDDSWSDALDERIRRMVGVDTFEITVNWAWSNPALSEISRFRVCTMAEVDGHLQATLRRIATTYSYDCGRLTHPLHPCINSIRVTPSARETYLDAAPYRTYLSECVAQRTLELQRAESTRG